MWEEWLGKVLRAPALLSWPRLCLLVSAGFSNGHRMVCGDRFIADIHEVSVLSLTIPAIISSSKR